MSKSRLIYYCYVLLDPRYPESYPGEYHYGPKMRFTHRPFYVGKGKGTRSSQHTKDVIAGRVTGNPHKFHIISKILKAGLEVIVVETPTKTSNEKALQLEEKLIAAIGRSDLNAGPLTNLTPGGESGTKGRISEATREKIRKAMIGRVITKEARAKLSTARKGAVFTPEHCRNISMAKAGKYRGPLSETTRAKISAHHKGRPLSEHHLAAIREAQRRRRAREALCKEGFFV